MGCCSSKFLLTNETKNIKKYVQNNITEEIERNETNENKIDYRNKINLIYSVKTQVLIIKIN